MKLLNEKDKNVFNSVVNTINNKISNVDVNNDVNDILNTEKLDKKDKKKKKKKSRIEELSLSSYYAEVGMVEINKFPNDVEPDFKELLDTEIAKFLNYKISVKEDLKTIRDKKVPGKFWIPLGIFIGLAAGGIGVIPGYFIGLSLSLSAASKHDKLCREAEKRIDIEEKLIIDRLKYWYEKNIKEYEELFKNKAKEESIKFIESNLVKEVSQRISKDFFEIIETADRRSHIEKIEVPYSFEVYSDKIIYQNKEFNFEIERCKNLVLPIEQTAVARAIATQIQVEVMSKFSEDPSGTTTFVGNNIEFKVKENKKHVYAEVIYSAPNGNYKEIKDWN